MADTLIETMSSNPYESIVSSTTGQINELDANIQKVTNAITTLERSNPTSPNLPKLKERLIELQNQKLGLSKTNDSAKLLMDSYNKGNANLNTLKGIFDFKQAELDRAQKEADASYRRMFDEAKRTGQNYVNALGNATSSENAIINYNAGRQGASEQSVAETRARNYLSNAQAQAEQAANTATNLNAIEENRLNSNAGYVQLSQNNADNYLRQQVMNDYEAAEAAKDRYAQYGSGGKGGGGYSYYYNNPGDDDDVDDEESTVDENGYPTLESIIADLDKQGMSPTYDYVHQKNPNITEDQFLAAMGGGPANTSLTDETMSNNRAGKYGIQSSNGGPYYRGTLFDGTNGGFAAFDGSKVITNVNPFKVQSYVDKLNKQYGEDFDINHSNGYITDGGYLILTNTGKGKDGKEFVRERAIPLSSVSDESTLSIYIDSNGKKRNKGS